MELRGRDLADLDVTVLTNAKSFEHVQVRTAYPAIMAVKHDLFVCLFVLFGTFWSTGMMLGGIEFRYFLSIPVSAKR